MATVIEALTITRSLLNDEVNVTWSDIQLFSKLKLAHIEMVAKMGLNGLPVTREETASLTITAGTTDLGVQTPTDLVQPIKMQEYALSDTVDKATPMVNKEFVPNWELTDTLRVWCWRDNKILFLGANTDRKVILYYNKSLTAPTQVTDPLPIGNSEMFLGPRVAALVCLSLKDTEGYAGNNGIAEANLSTIVRTQVKGSQSLPARRQPFSNRFRRGRRLAF